MVFETLGAQCMRQREDDGEVWHRADYGYCQSGECRRLIIRLVTEEEGVEASAKFVEPHGKARADFRHVPRSMLSDYEQACAVLYLSPAASAALARRCLQGVIREHFNIREANLLEEIKKVADLKTLPPYLADGLGKIREIGNLAAHPAHDSEFDVIINVEREDAEWTLEILESLFRHCYVEPMEYKQKAQDRQKRSDRAKDHGAGKARERTSV